MVWAWKQIVGENIPAPLSGLDDESHSLICCEYY